VLLATMCCVKSTVSPVDLSARVDRVKVTQAGMIYVNGKTTSIDDLRKEFAQLKAENGSVWYYRENPQGEPPEQAMNVMQAVVDNKLPIRMCKSEAELNATNK